MFRVVLVEPEIPQNTGNIARTCVCTGVPLILTRPMGFEITEAKVRRAGLDYWPDLDLTILDSLCDVYGKFPDSDFWYFSSKGKKLYTEASYAESAVLVFGRETKGLPADLIERNASHCVRIPMVPEQRCLNLSNAVCTALYEAFRQHDFPGLY